MLGKVTTKARAQHELRKLGLHTEDLLSDDKLSSGGRSQESTSPRSRKRRKNDALADGREEAIILNLETKLGSDTDQDSVVRKAPHANYSGAVTTTGGQSQHYSVAHGKSEDTPNLETIKVLKLSWYTDSVTAGHLLPYEHYLVYEGRVVSGQGVTTVEAKTSLPGRASILARAEADSTSAASQTSFKHGSRKFASLHSQPARLLPQTTADENLPPVPDCLHNTFCCQRPTPLHCPNEAFLSQLRAIKKARILAGDDIGVRAYSAAVATIASYPYTLTSAFELTRLPSCGPKFGVLWQEWSDFGHIKEVDDLEADSRLKSLKIFYEIYDVGEANARKFYNNGWRDLDDVIEYGCKDPFLLICMLQLMRVKPLFIY